MKPSPKHQQTNDFLRIGTAGWTLPKQHAHHFSVPENGEKLSHLQRYALRLNSVEINSSFHRPHMRKTWERWAASTPAGFRFSVKVPKAVTHEAKLCNCGAALQTFFGEVGGLGDKLGPVLVQLPPRLAFEAGTALEFFTTLRELHSGLAVIEPRHASWFVPAAERLLREFEVARAMADPPAGSPLAAEPGGWPALCYFRLHGSPRKYWSPYSDEYLRMLAARLAERKPRVQTWVIFDNTAGNHALGNALKLRTLLNGSGSEE
jgi:uncharacterized protein YecE (DUF72 family)